MGSSNPFKEQQYSSFMRNKLLTWTLFALLSIAFIHFYFYTDIPILSSSTQDQFISINSIVVNTTSSSPSSSFSSSSSPSQEEDNPHVESRTCDYTDGKWVNDKQGPMYNGTSCGTIKEGQNCMSHGRPDTGYLYWRWKPNECQVPRRGIGWHLLKASEELICQMSLSTDIYLHCRMTNIAPYNMYTRAGYSVHKTDNILILLTLQSRKHLMCKHIIVSTSSPKTDVSEASDDYCS